MKKEGNSSRMEFWGTLKREIRILKKTEIKRAGREKARPWNVLEDKTWRDLNENHSTVLM